MEEVDEFGTETLRSQLLHPFTGLDHWLLAIGVLSWIVLAHRFLTQRNASMELDPLAPTNKSASLLGMMKRRSETVLTPR
jgi:hypothetical protein